MDNKNNPITNIVTNTERVPNNAVSIIVGETFSLILLNNRPQHNENKVNRINLINGGMGTSASTIIMMNDEMTNAQKESGFFKRSDFTLNAIIKVTRS